MAKIREVYSFLEIRIVVWGSLLIIYEADWTRAEQSLISLSEEEDENDDDEMDEAENNSRLP